MLPLFRFLLRLYPADFFREFGAEMTSVFRQRCRDVRHQGLTVRALFLAREFRGMVTGALREQSTGVSFRRLDMRSFRFPRTTIGVMLVTLLSVGIAIERARQIAIGRDTESIRPAMPAVFGVMLMVTVILGLIGYVILRAVRNSGAQRVSRIQIKPQHR